MQLIKGTNSKVCTADPEVDVIGSVLKEQLVRYLLGMSAVGTQHLNSAAAA